MEVKPKPSKIYTIPSSQVTLWGLRKPIVEVTPETINWLIERLQQRKKKTPMIFEEKEEITVVFDDAILVARKDRDLDYVEIVPIEDMTLPKETPKVEFTFENLKKEARKAGLKIYESQNIYWMISEGGVPFYARKNLDMVDLEMIKVNKLSLPPEAPTVEMELGELLNLSFKRSLPVWETSESYIVLADYICIARKKR